MLLARAEIRWREILAEQPDLEPAVALQRALLTRVIDLAAGLDPEALPALAHEYVAGKLRRGIPVLRGEPIVFPVGLLAPVLECFCEDLTAGGAGDSARHIGEALASGRIEGASLLAASLARDQHAVRTSSMQLGLAPDLVWLIGELAAGPFAHAMERRHLHDACAADRAESTPDPDDGNEARGSVRRALAEWDRGYCPNCGSWPALAEFVPEGRVLRCSFCAASWQKRSYGCVYCGEEGEEFVTSAPCSERPDRLVELCASCGGYLKGVRLPALTEFPLVAVEDLGTTDLDRAAMARGFGRPPLPIA